MADRWHLLKNMREAVARYLAKRYQQIKDFVMDIITQEQLDTGNMKGSEKRRRYAPGPVREAIHNARTAETPPETTQFALPTVIELAWLPIRPKSEFQDEEVTLWQLLQRDPQLVELRTLARQFITMVNERQASHWEGWHELVEQSSLAEIKQFAQGLKRDGTAVVEALRQPYSNGRTEGHVNRLKLI